MKPILPKLIVVPFTLVVFAVAYHYWPKEPQYVGVKADTQVEIHSAKGIVTEESKP